MSAETTVVSEGIAIVPNAVDDREAVHKSAVSEIIGLVIAKYEDEGTRNFAIGKRALEHAQWQKGNFPGYEASDFDTLMNNIRDQVRLQVAIKSSSIRVGDWVKSYVLRTLVAESLGEDRAGKLSFFEYRTLIGRALAFDRKSVEGSLVPGWLDMITDIATTRLTGGRVSTERFFELVEATEKRLTAANAKPVSPGKALAEKAADSAKANRAVSTAVSDALEAGNLSTENIVAIVDHLAKEHKQSMPAQFGFNPVSCTVEDCDLLASAMFQAGKFAEMKRLVERLAPMVASVEKLREQQTRQADVEPVKVKARREQAKAESKSTKAAA
jgi:hypothetical protein